MLKRGFAERRPALSWARKRGVVTFFIFFTIAVVVVVVWYLTR